MKRSIFILLIISVFNRQSISQDNVLTAGIQIKPIFTSKFFNTGSQSKDSSGVRFDLNPKGGYCVGAIVRYGITNRVSAETGINFIKRPYQISITNDSLSFSGTSPFAIIGYEIPLSALVFIQLSEYIFMDASLGMSFDFFPSSVQSEDEYFKHLGRRRSWIFPAVTANLGYEYRTVKSGYFYLGASYHRPFRDIFENTFIYYINDKYFSGQRFLLSGNYLTVDFRYYFHEDPLKKQKKKKK